LVENYLRHKPNKGGIVVFEGCLFQSIRGNQELLPFKQQLRQLGQKTAWYLNFDVNAFDFIEGKEWGSLLGASWQRKFHADSRWSEELQ
jgi:hypothetical protein